MENRRYTAEDITVNELNLVRQNYDIFYLSSQIKKRGDLVNLAYNSGINAGTLHRAICEAKILSILPDINSSKIVPLSRLKVYRERILFLKRHNVEDLSFREIYESIKKWRILLENNPRILLTDEQHDLIIGSTLGDANIRKRERNSGFRIEHSEKQKEYLFWKYNILKEFTKKGPHNTLRKRKENILETFNFSTFTHSVFNFYHKLFYKDGKKFITRKMLDMLTPRSLAIWICDDGSFGTNQPYIILCTNSYSLEEHKTIKKYFEEVWKLSPTIGFRDKKYYYLRFNQEDTKRLIEIIKPFILDSLRYKIGEKNE